MKLRALVVLMLTLVSGASALPVAAVASTSQAAVLDKLTTIAGQIATFLSSPPGAQTWAAMTKHMYVIADALTDGLAPVSGSIPLKIREAKS